MYPVEHERLTSFIKEYEWLLRHPPTNSQGIISAEQEAIMGMFIINLCTICEQNKKSSAYWHNAEIDNFVKNHIHLYKKNEITSR